VGDLGRLQLHIHMFISQALQRYHTHNTKQMQALIEIFGILVQFYQLETNEKKTLMHTRKL